MVRTPNIQECEILHINTFLLTIGKPCIFFLSDQSMKNGNVWQKNGTQSLICIEFLLNSLQTEKARNIHCDHFYGNESTLFYHFPSIVGCRCEFYLGALYYNFLLTGCQVLLWNKPIKSR